jgi:hypothetical protein
MILKRLIICEKGLFVVDIGLYAWRAPPPRLRDLHSSGPLLPGYRAVFVSRNVASTVSQGSGQARGKAV